MHRTQIKFQHFSRSLFLVYRIYSNRFRSFLCGIGGVVRSLCLHSCKQFTHFVPTKRATATSKKKTAQTLAIRSIDGSYWKWNSLIVVQSANSPSGIVKFPTFTYCSTSSWVCVCVGVFLFEVPLFSFSPDFFFVLAEMLFAAAAAASLPSLSLSLLLLFILRLLCILHAEDLKGIREFKISTKTAAQNG